MHAHKIEFAMYGQITWLLHKAHVNSISTARTHIVFDFARVKTPHKMRRRKKWLPFSEPAYNNNSNVWRSNCW